MADKNAKVEENVSGKFYVDLECIGCGVCSSEAPNNFKLKDDSSHAFVFMQPKNEAEVKICLEAMESCPVDAIGDDG